MVRYLANSARWRANRAPTAAKAALRRKKQFEHSLEQTSSQIMTLEREIYSIETANINKETLDAMKNAGTAMKQIHAGLTIDKVDNVMYAFPLPPKHLHSRLLPTGKTSANSTPSAKKSPKPSLRVSPHPASTKTSSTRNWLSSSRSSSTSRCSTQATFPSATRSAVYPRRLRQNSRARRPSRRTTRRQSCGGCRQRWPCKVRT